ncbi:MAG: hypothetical protein Q9213_006542 [Squamulea squamosa]
MSAEALGANLLQEVKVEGLDELLRSLRYIQEQQKPQTYTSQPVIDRLLNAFAPARNRPDAVHQRQEPVLELVGSSPCSGRTQLLYLMISRLLLPPAYENLSLAGRNTAVILFDLGNNFSILRLRDVITQQFRSCKFDRAELHEKAFTQLVHKTLDHLHVFRPQSSSSLLITLSSLRSYILDVRSHISANRAVGAIILNHVDTFLWQDRLDDAEAQTIDTKKLGLLSSRFRDLVAHVRRLQVDFSCLVVATTSALSSTTHTCIDGHPVPVLQSHLPSVWRSFVTVRLICEREQICKFPLGMSAEEAAVEAEQRREAVDNSGFTASLDWSESEAWWKDTKTTIRAMRGGGLTFTVTAQGVCID